MSDQFPSLVIAVFDAARAQNFGCYGYGLETTPFLSSLSKKAAVYNNAICSSYWTLPSFASLFTGTYVSGHGLFIDGHKLRSDMTTLAEYLSSNGYDTAGFCQNPYVSDFTGLDRGFDHFENVIHRRYGGFVKIMKKLVNPLIGRKGKELKVHHNEKQAICKASTESLSRMQWFSKYFSDKGASDMNRRITAWLKNRKEPKKPFFLFLLYGESHAPYCPPWPYRRKFIKHHEPVSRPLRKINQTSILYHSKQISMDNEDFAGLKALYDGCIAYSDKCVKALYDELNRTGDLDNTIFIVTSDHGDNLGEHELISHTLCLYDTLIRIPLVIKWPHGIGPCGSIEKVVQNVDIFPTMVDLIGSKDDISNQLEGRSLLSDISFHRPEGLAISELIKPFGPDAQLHRELLSQFDRRLVSLRTEKYKYIWSSNNRHEFFDISSDPQEEKNLYNERVQSEEFGKLAVAAEPWIARVNGLYEKLKDEIEMRGAPEIDEDIKTRLTQLGYF